MITGATQSCFRYLNLETDLKISYNPADCPDILWAHYSYDQPIFQTPHLCEIKNIVCVSEWQRSKFIKYLKIPENRITVIRNGGARVFRYTGIQKSKTLIYTSTPFRGLEYLPDIWKLVLEKHPDAKLKVFSSMNLYGQADPVEYFKLYDRINALPNAQHYYPVSHDELAAHLQDAAVFCYPNTWEETSCVSLIEAMRSGCYPIITDIGALTETACGFGSAVPMTGINTTRGWQPDHQFISSFANTVNQILDRFDSNDIDHKSISDFSVQHYDWDQIRNIWYEYIKRIKMSEQQNTIKPVTFSEAITDSYIDRAKQVALRWADRDRELCQTTSDFQIEKFIAMNYNTISHAVENILRNRKAAALNLFNKSIEMTERQREFDMRWKDQPKDQPIRWEDERGNKRWIWYDLDSRQHDIYMYESENSIRDACYQIDTYDRILEKMEEANGGPITRQQFNEEAAENWKRKFQANVFDDMLSRQTGINPGVIDSFRKVMAPGILDADKHTIGFNAVPSFDQALDDPVRYMTEMSKGIEEKIAVFDIDSRHSINRTEAPTGLQIEDWFNLNGSSK